MSNLRLTIENGKFCDTNGRQVILRGINVAGEAKYPSKPNQPSHVANNFFDGDKVSFVGRPFPKDDAHLHFSRLKRCGYNTIRYVFTWEAIEAARFPGIYDRSSWIERDDRGCLRAGKKFTGSYIFMDPHQDVWSRFSGGSGAPMWTLYAAGLNPENFAVTEAAIVHNTYPDPNAFPKMIWSTNYFRLAAATMFTLFFAGKDFAPKCIIDGINIQDYLQGHFLRACAHLARRIHEAGDIENEVVFGWESMNEPNKGMVGYEDISVIPKEQALKKGTCPTIWQTMLAGSGRAVDVEMWDMGGLGPYKVGRTMIDPQGEIAWLPSDYDDSRYGYKRDPGWKLGECIWAQHGVWDPSTDTLLKKDYFGKHPTTGDTIDYPYFTNNYLMDHFRKYRDMVCSVGRYWHPALAIKLGETAIRNCFRDQHAAMRQEGLDRIGNHPCVMTEFGIPYDMDDKYAYKTGDYSSQSAAMDANHFGVEAAGLEGYTLWLYMASNDHENGDQWNGEDLSIVSVDDKLLPLSARPKTPEVQDSTSNLQPPTPRKELDDDESVTPANIKRTITNPSISSEATSRQPELTSSPGYRAAEAYDACSVEVSSGKWEISSDEEETVLIQRLRWWHGKGEQTLKVSGVVKKHNIGEGAEDSGYYEQCNQGAWSNCTVI
ncbi:hypothetical protein CHGG_09617 [Chaetomium globosum CBS 148.51]|uniref:Glycoside hydrolase family 5 domain-containing protein n=1 Tax=Chaetomium globosum (strain ATCC 6205 / CBS 148.51 / DSM 1962 / NBRC 6347 / NRRL 1970) TaxID=306901 RepID=Q2GQY7_CHAGB|nr:uncharacterized protein CHGG_09617 [Chaetomium globosum CBS 148.51]EAQ83213.1 hypothetical protein CHGG_09617 [Chaetomium globosum CBS 148.51]